MRGDLEAVGENDEEPPLRSLPSPSPTPYMPKPIFTPIALLVWPIIILCFSGCASTYITTATPESPSSCYRFLSFDSPHQGLEQLIPLPQVGRPATNAVYVLFIGETILENAEAVGFDTIVHVLEWSRVNLAPGEFARSG